MISRIPVLLLALYFLASNRGRRLFLSAKIPARSQKLNEYLVCRAMLSPWLACRLLLLNPFFLVWQKNLIFHIDMVANFALCKNESKITKLPNVTKKTLIECVLLPFDWILFPLICICHHNNIKNCHFRYDYFCHNRKRGFLSARQDCDQGRA